MLKSNKTLWTTLIAGSFALTVAAASAAPGQKGHAHGDDAQKKAQGEHMGHNMPGGMRLLPREAPRLTGPEAGDL